MTDFKTAYVLVASSILSLLMSIGISNATVKKGMVNVIKRMSVVTVFVGLLLTSACTSKRIKIEKDIKENLMDTLRKEETVVTQAIAQEVSFDVQILNDKQVQVVVEAPDISRSMIKWAEKADDNITEGDIERVICDFLESEEKERNEFVLEYKNKKGELTIEYTDEYRTAVDCGISEFYEYVMERAISELLEDSVNE